jgi:hypothetical protein
MRALSAGNVPVGPTDRERGLQIGAVAAISMSAGWLIAHTPSGSAVPVGVGALILVGALIRQPAVSIAIVVTLAGAFGRTGAHWLVPWIGLPLLEVLIVMGGGAALLCLGARAGSSGRPLAIPTLVWLPAAGWGLLLVVFFNHGDVISGSRDAAMFIYPLLIALTLASIPVTAFRRVSEQAIPWLIPLAFVVAAIGFSNALSGHTSVTSTGQTRALAGSFSAPLVAGLLAALWMFQVREWSTGKTLVACLPAGALLLVNHRSAYLALIASVLTFVYMRRASPLKVTHQFGRVFRRAAVGLVVVLTLTPFGRAGLSRFLATAQPDDPNVAYRLEATERALDREGGARLFGSGVGQFQTNLGADLSQAEIRGVHDSFAASFEFGGAVGALALIVPILWCCRRMWRHRWDPLIQVLLPLSVFGVVMAGFNVTLENLYFGVWLWVPLIAGAMVALSEAHQHRPGLGHAAGGPN